jgi:excisionase family DNA binding protein
MSEQRTELTFSIAEVARHLGLSKNHSYLLAARGDLPVIRIGRRIRVPVRALEKLLEAAEVTPMK